MLDHKPGVSSFTRASYDLELHGRIDDARAALQRAVADATSPSETRQITVKTCIAREIASERLTPNRTGIERSPCARSKSRS